MLLTAAKKDVWKDGHALSSFTGYGLVPATTAAVAGAFGELWIGYKIGSTFDLGGWEDRAVLCWVLAVLLGWYTLATFNATLKAGKTEPAPEPPSGVARLAALVAEALRRNDKIPNHAIGGIVEEVTKPPPLTGPADMMKQALEVNARLGRAVGRRSMSPTAQAYAPDFSRRLG